MSLKAPPNGFPMPVHVKICNIGVKQEHIAEEKGRLAQSKKRLSISIFGGKK
jgi:hypothetical protein